MMIQDQRGRGALESAVPHPMQSAVQSPDVACLFSLFNTRTPRVYADIDRVQSEVLSVPMSRVFETLEMYLGSSFTNEFNLLGRTFRVTAQADGQFRLDLHAIANLKTRNDAGEKGVDRRSCRLPVPHRRPSCAALQPLGELQCAVSPARVYMRRAYRHVALEKLYASRIHHVTVGAVARAPSSACGMKHRGSEGPKSYGTQSGQLLHQSG